MKQWISVVLMALTLAATQAVADTYYKWQDDAGVTHYGALPPPGVDALPVSTRTGSTPSAPAVAAQPVASQSQQEFQEQLQQTKAARKAEMAKACEQARKARLNFEAKHRIRLKQADGSYKMLSHEEKMAEIEKLDEQINDYCNRE